MFCEKQSGKLFNGFLILLTASFFAACSGTRPITEADLMAEMKKTPCYGQCPVYTIKISKNGKGVFEGTKNVEKIGTYSFRLSGKEMDELVASFEKIRFFELDDRYHKLVSDLPTTWLTYQTGGKQKKIMDYYGAPKELKDLEKQIETLVLSQEMKKVK